MTQAEFVDYIARQVQRETKGSVNKAAGLWGLSTQYLRDVLMHRREPGPKVVEALGYEVVTTKVYRLKKQAKGSEGHSD